MPMKKPIKLEVIEHGDGLGIITYTNNAQTQAGAESLRESIESVVIIESVRLRLLRALEKLARR